MNEINAVAVDMMDSAPLLVTTYQKDTSAGDFKEYTSSLNIMRGSESMSLDFGYLLSVEDEEDALKRIHAGMEALRTLRDAITAQLEDYIVVSSAHIAAITGYEPHQEPETDHFESVGEWKGTGPVGEMIAATYKDEIQRQIDAGDFSAWGAGSDA